MTDNSDESRLTSYALNELSAAERQEFEAEAGGADAASRNASAIQVVAQSLTAAVATERTSRLTSDRRKRIQAEVRRQTTKRFFGRKQLVSIAVASAAAMACVLILKMATLSRSQRDTETASSLVRRLHVALIQYQSDFKQLPPDTGFGLAATDVSAGAGRTYDAGSLWRYLGRERVVAGKTYGPYINFSASELRAYTDPLRGESFAVIDPWGTAVGYVGDSRRVIHNHGSFDLFSAGPDRKTGADLASQRVANLAYDGLDNDGDGVIDNAQELGSARMNGCLTLALTGAQLPRDVLDDVNNWDQ